MYAMVFIFMNSTALGLRKYKAVGLASPALVWYTIMLAIVQPLRFNSPLRYIQITVKSPSISFAKQGISRLFPY